MNFTDRPNADRSFLLAVAKQRDADREKQTDSDTLRDALRAQMQERLGPDEVPRPSPFATKFSDPHRDQRIRELFARDWSDRAIASEVEMSRAGVQHARRRMGLERKPQTFEDPEDRDNFIRRLYLRGYTDVEIAKMVGLSRPAVTDARHRLGLETRFGKAGGA